MANRIVRTRVGGYAASELDIRREVTEAGDEDHELLMAWDGDAVATSDETREGLAWQAVHLANGLDDQLYKGAITAPEERKAMRHAAAGLWGLAARLRHR